MPLFHELFLHAVHSHEASAPRTRMFCRVRAAIMPRSLVASFALKNQKKRRLAWKAPFPFNLLTAAPETTFLSLGPNSSKAPFLRARLFVNEWTLAAPESTAVATMWALGGSSFISQVFLWLDAQNCSVFGDVKATFMEQNWGGWTGSVFHEFPRNNEAFGATLEVRRTADPRLGFGLFWWENGSEQVVSCSKKRAAYFTSSIAQNGLNILDKLVHNCVGGSF